MTIRRYFHPALLAIACAFPFSAHTQAVSPGGGTTVPAHRPDSISPGVSELAPRMKVQVLSRSKQETTYAVIFGVGDEVVAGLTEFAQQHHLASARITGIGGIQDATVGFFDPQQKRHLPIPINQPAEVLSLLGDIALFHGKPVVHVHMVVGFPDGSAHGGHLLMAHVWPTMEVIVTEYPNPMHKTLDPDTGVAVIRPAEKQ